MTTSDKRQRCRERYSACVVVGLEHVFYTLGRTIAAHPKRTICACVIVSLLCALGALRFSVNNDLGDMMLLPESPLHGQRRWIQEHGVYDLRPVRAIVVADNVLTRRALLAMHDLYRRVDNVRGDNNTGLEDFCSKIMGKCAIRGLLDLWQHSGGDNHMIKNSIQNLTDDDVIRHLNLANSQSFNSSDHLGGVTYDSDGRIVGSRAASITWMLEVNSTTEKRFLQFRDAMVKELLKGHPDLQHVYVFYKHAFREEFLQALYDDVVLIMIGAPLMLLYMLCSMGKPTLVEHGFWLVTAALSGVGLAACVAHGLCLAVGIMYTITHQALMFLFLAIGVDDAFIILETWKRTDREYEDASLEEKLALTMKHAGVSISVSSVSNAAAFAVGIASTIPVLHSVSAYAVVGVLALLILQSTLFPACLILEKRRVRDKRDALVLCYKHRKYKPNGWCDIEIIQSFFEKVYAPVLLSTPVKIIVILATMTMAAVMTWKVTMLEKSFNMERAIPEASFVRKYMEAQRHFFPSEGLPVTVYCGPLDYSRNIRKLDRMVTSYENSSTVARAQVFSWIRPFRHWLQNLNKNGTSVVLNEDGFPDDSSLFNKYLYRFTHDDPFGAMFGRSLELTNASSNTTIEWTSYPMAMTYNTNDLSAVNEQKLEDLRTIVHSTTLDGSCFVYGDYFIWIEVTKYVDKELIRNFIIAGVAILIITSLLIGDPRVSFIVFLCVIFTTVCLGGVFSILNFSLNGNHVLLLTYSIGLSVDFSAHVGYTFMTVTGSRNERAHAALSRIGPAVFHGAATTLMVFIVTSMAKSYSLYLFFCTFVSVVVFGVFHGLCFLPVILSLIGPRPYRSYRHGHGRTKTRCRDNEPLNDERPMEEFITTL